MDPTTVTQFLGLTPEQTAALVTIGALSTSFFFVWNLIRQPIQALIDGLKNFFIRVINLHISEPDYNKVNLWLEQNEQHIYFQRSYKVVNSQGKSEDDYGYDDDEDTKKKSQNKLIAGFGTILVNHPDHPLMIIRRTKEEAKQIFQQTESVSIQFLTLKSERIVKFFDEVTNLKENDGPYVWASQGDWWQQRGVPKAVSDPVGVGAREMIDSVDQFMASREDYDRRMLQFKRGYMMHGQPGTGKTSILSYIAQKHGLHIYTLGSDSLLKMDRLTSRLKPNSMIVIEDIDLSVVGSSRDDDDSVTKVANKDALNNFLNAIDGITEFNASLIIATTNNPTALDPAMVRPGRIDEIIEIGLLNSADQITHVNNFFGSTYNINNYELPDRTFAELQLICTSNMLNPDRAIQCLYQDRKENQLKNHVASKDNSLSPPVT